MRVCMREIHIANVVASTEDCSKGGGSGNVAQEGTAPNKRKRETGWAGIHKRSGIIEHIYVGRVVDRCRQWDTRFETGNSWKKGVDIYIPKEPIADQKLDKYINTSD